MHRGYSGETAECREGDGLDQKMGAWPAKERVVAMADGEKVAWRGEKCDRLWRAQDYRTWMMVAALRAEVASHGEARPRRESRRRELSWVRCCRGWWGEVWVAVDGAAR